MEHADGGCSLPFAIAFFVAIAWILVAVLGG